MNADLDVRVVESRIRQEEAGRTLADHLAKRFTYRDRAGWIERIAAGELHLDDRVAAADDVLLPGMVLRYFPGEIAEPPVDLRYQVVYEDDSVLVIDKSGDLPTHPSGIFYRNTLWYLLRKRFGAIHFVNRLDRETSGLLLAARNPEMAAALSGKIMEKHYLALVYGVFPEHWDAAGFLTRDPQSMIRKKRRFAAELPPGEKGETAETRFRLLKSNGTMSLVEAIPVTGRLHQIRATLYSLGYPLAGDKLYGVDEQCFLQFCREGNSPAMTAHLGMPRQALHSARFSFFHPEKQKLLTFCSSYPEDFLHL
ncbi:MAG: RluA family pseudouridine synthase [Lentisphaeria bacterium]|nr:RluA family pseudouridine synthase [Lentisphaeria bacterium]